MSKPSSARSFLLLEVMIALAIIALCAVPLIRQPILYYRAQIRFLKESDLQRIADLAFAEIKESLLQEAIPWKNLPSKKQEALDIPLSPAALDLPSFEETSIRRHCKLLCVGEKKGRGKTILRLYEAKIFVESSSFTYRILLKAVSASSDSAAL